MFVNEDIVGKVNSTQKGDSLLWLEYKSGNSRAFEKLYRKYSPLLYNYGRHLNNEHELIKDCLQELFADLWSTRENVSEVKNIKSYLFLAFRRRVIEEAVKRRKFIGEEILLTKSDFEIAFSHESILILDQLSEEQKKNMLVALNSLSGRQREAIFLKFHDDLTFNEIASIMSIHIDSVYNIISKAIAILRKIVKKAALIFYPISFLAALF